MYLTWYGQSCFKIQTKEKNILINPFGPKEAGLKGPNLRAEIVILSNSADYERAIRAFPPETFLIYGPGEYEISDMVIDGIGCVDKNKINTVFRFEIEKVKIGFLAELGRLLKEEEIEKFNGIDLLLIPVGGPIDPKSRTFKGQTLLKAEEAVKLIGQLEPKVVIPYYYQISGLKPGHDKKLGSLDKFLHLLGLKPSQAAEKLKISARDLAGNKKLELIILTPKTF